MFENFTTAIIQLIGFLGVFAFFVYQLLSDKNNVKKKKSFTKTLDSNLKKESKSGFFRRRGKVILEEPSNNKKKGWFQK